MIVFPQRVIDILSHNDVEACYLLQIGSTKVTSFFTSVTTSDNAVYTPNSSLLSVDPPQQSSSVDSQQYSLSFSDPEFIFGAESENGLIGKSVSVYICLLDPVTKLLETNVANLILLYKGYVAGAGFQISLETIGESTFVLTCTSPMSNLDMARTFHGNKTFMRENINPDDSTFDNIYEGGGVLRKKWGKL